MSNTHNGNNRIPQEVGNMGETIMQRSSSMKNPLKILKEYESNTITPYIHNSISPTRIVPMASSEGHSVPQIESFGTMPQSLNPFIAINPSNPNSRHAELNRRHLNKYFKIPNSNINNRITNSNINNRITTITNPNKKNTTTYNIPTIINKLPNTNPTTTNPTTRRRLTRSGGRKRLRRNRTRKH